jgi:hypothetical protein
LSTSVLNDIFFVSASDGADSLDDVGQRVFGEVQIELAGLDLGDVQDGVNQTQEVLAIRANAGEGIEGLGPLFEVRGSCCCRAGAMPVTGGHLVSAGEIRSARVQRVTCFGGSDIAGAVKGRP